MDEPTLEEFRPGKLWPGVGVGAIVIQDESLLMILRAGKHGAGTWSVPGGWVDLGEHPFQSAVREVLEETGIDVRAVEAHGWTSVTHCGGPHAITLWIRCRWIKGKPRITEPDKCPEVTLVPFNEINDGRPLFAPFAQWWNTHPTWKKWYD